MEKSVSVFHLDDNCAGNLKIHSPMSRLVESVNFKHFEIEDIIFSFVIILSALNLKNSH